MQMWVSSPYNVFPISHPQYAPLRPNLVIIQPASFDALVPHPYIREKKDAIFICPAVRMAPKPVSLMVLPVVEEGSSWLSRGASLAGR